MEGILIYLSIAIYFCINGLIAGIEYERKRRTWLIYLCFLIGTPIAFFGILIAVMQGIYESILYYFGETELIMHYRFYILKEFKGLKKWQIENAKEAYKKEKSERWKRWLLKIIELNTESK